MPSSVELTPPNSIVLIVGSRTGGTPSEFGNGLVAANKDCIAVGCRAEDDGPTHFWVGPSAEVNAEEAPVIVGNLETPNGSVMVQTIFGETIAEASTDTLRTSVTIWANDPFEPNLIQIGIGQRRS